MMVAKGPFRWNKNEHACVSLHPRTSTALRRCVRGPSLILMVAGRTTASPTPLPWPGCARFALFVCRGELDDLDESSFADP